MITRGTRRRENVRLCLASLLIVLFNQMSQSSLVVSSSEFINSSQASAKNLLLFGSNMSQPNATLSSVLNSTETEATQTMLASTTTDDVDLVISSSEILSPTSSGFPIIKQRPTMSTTTTTTTNEPENSTNVVGNLFDLLDDNASAFERDAPESVSQQSSRLLLQLLILGLFTLVSSSLILVYTVKFCVCRRRKRLLLRRALVGDSSSASSANDNSSNFLNLAEQCACFAPILQHSNELRSLLINVDRATGNQDGQQQHQQQIWSTPLARQRHTAATLQLQQHLAQLAQTFQLASTIGAHGQPALAANCNQCHPSSVSSISPACIASQSPINLPGAANDNNHFSRPPTYSQLFGPPMEVLAPRDADHIGSTRWSLARRRRQESMSLGANQNMLTTTNMINMDGGRPAASTCSASQQSMLPSNNNNNNVTDDNNNNNNHSTSNYSTSSTSSSSSSSATSNNSNNNPTGEHHQNQQQINLLVRLNLNKTKLLSPADLMLLSKLIDVPIVIQERHHRHHQQRHQPSSSSSVNNDDDDDDEREEEEEEEEDDHYRGDRRDLDEPRRIRSQLEELARLQQLSVWPPSSSQMDSTGASSQVDADANDANVDSDC